MEGTSSAESPDGVSQSYGRQLIGSLGPVSRPPVSLWRRGAAGKAPDGRRFVFYGGHIRVGGDQGWRTNNRGTLFINAFSRACGAIGHDGRVAIFSTEQQGRNALAAILRSPAYADVAIHQILSDFIASSTEHDRVTGSALAERAALDPQLPLGSLSGEALKILSDLIIAGQGAQAGAEAETTVISGEWIDTFSSAGAGTIYLPGSYRNPHWARTVFHAKTGATGRTTRPATTPPPPPCYWGDPTNWQSGVWYQEQADGTFVVSSNQDPRNAGIPGTYMQYAGSNTWNLDVIGPQGQSSDTPSVPFAQAPDCGTNCYCINTIVFADGTEQVTEHFPPDENLEPPPLPPGSAVSFLPDGSVVATYTKDKPTDPGTNPEDAGDAGNSDDGDDESPDAEPDDGGTYTP